MRDTHWKNNSRIGFPVWQHIICVSLASVHTRELDIKYTIFFNDKIQLIFPILLLIFFYYFRVAIPCWSFANWPITGINNNKKSNDIIITDVGFSQCRTGITILFSYVVFFLIDRICNSFWLWFFRQTYFFFTTLHSIQLIL